MRGIDFDLSGWFRPYRAGEIGLVCSRAFSPGCHIAGLQPARNGARNKVVPAQGPKVRNVIARPEGPGGRTTKISKGLQGRSNIPPLQGLLKLVWTGSQAFSPGYYRARLSALTGELAVAGFLWRVVGG